MFFLQKQPSRDVLRKRCSKVVGQLYWKHTLTWMLSSKFVAYFQNTFSLTKPLGGGLFLFLESKTQCNMNWLNAPSRNSHRSCSIEKSFPKNFSKFTEKPVNFYEIFQNTFFTERPQWLLLSIFPITFTRENVVYYFAYCSEKL